MRSSSDWQTCWSKCLKIALMLQPFVADPSVLWSDGKITTTLFRAVKSPFTVIMFMVSQKINEAFGFCKWKSPGPVCVLCSSEREHTAFYRKERAHGCDDIQSAHYKCLEKMVRHAEKPIRAHKGNTELVAKWKMFGRDSGRESAAWWCLAVYYPYSVSDLTFLKQIFHNQSSFII